jgi:hypothetical protein
MLRRLSLITTCAVVTLAVTMTALAGGVAAPDPKTLVLEPSDLPTGFVRDHGNYYSNSNVAHDNGEPLIFYALKGMGRIDGYEAYYSSLSGPSAKGAQAIVGSVSVYRTASGARASFETHPVGFPTPADFTDVSGTDSHPHRLPAPRVGQKAILLRYSSAGGGDPGYVLVWLSGRFLGDTTVYSRPSAALQALTAALARKQQARMAKAA